MRRMDLGIAGKVALVTGASSGLGLATARALAAEGCHVAINARNADRLSAAAATIADDAFALPGDVTDPAVPEALVARTVERFGGLDILVANAGGPPPARALELDDDAIHAALETNLVTSIRLVRSALPHLRHAGWGRILCLTSWGVKQPIPELAASNLARTGLWAWAKTAAADLVAEEITVNLLCPGPHATDRARALGLTGRLGNPDDFGRVAAFLCSVHTGYLTGAALQIDGAATLGLL